MENKWYKAKTKLYFISVFCAYFRIRSLKIRNNAKIYK